jgi:hypothetical protein
MDVLAKREPRIFQALVGRGAAQLVPRGIAEGGAAAVERHFLEPSKRAPITPGGPRSLVIDFMPMPTHSGETQSIPSWWLSTSTRNAVSA